MAKPNNNLVTGNGTLPASKNLGGSITTHIDNPLKISVTGVKTVGIVREGNSIFANNELRRVQSIFPNGDLLIATPFSIQLVDEELKLVENGRFKEISVFNNSDNITGSVNGNPCPPKIGFRWKEKDNEGLDAIYFDTNGADFLISTTE